MQLGSQSEKKKKVKCCSCDLTFHAGTKKNDSTNVILATHNSICFLFDYKNVSLGCVCGLQVHRRGRALRKFAKQLTEGTVVMSSRSMQNFIMPYAMIALFDEKLLKVVTVVTVYMYKQLILFIPFQKMFSDWKTNVVFFLIYRHL